MLSTLFSSRANRSKLLNYTCVKVINKDLNAAQPFHIFDFLHSRTFLRVIKTDVTVSGISSSISLSYVIRFQQLPGSKVTGGHITEKAAVKIVWVVNWKRPISPTCEVKQLLPNGRTQIRTRDLPRSLTCCPRPPGPSDSSSLWPFLMIKLFRIKITKDFKSLFLSFSIGDFCQMMIKLHFHTF